MTKYTKAMLDADMKALQWYLDMRDEKVSPPPVEELDWIDEQNFDEDHTSFSISGKGKCYVLPDDYVRFSDD